MYAKRFIHNFKTNSVFHGIKLYKKYKLILMLKPVQLSMLCLFIIENVSPFKQTRTLTSFAAKLLVK